MGMEVIEANAGIDMVHVAYKGNGPANLDLAAGRLDILMGSISGIQLVRTGKARLIGVATPQRLSDYPDVPTVSESGLLNYELSNTYSLYAPIRTATSIIAGLNREVIDLLSAPELKAKFAADFATAAPPRSPEELRKILLSDIERWDGVVKKAGIKLEE